MQSGRSWPDLFIAHPSRGYHGLFIELKKEGTTIVVTKGNRKGRLSADKHIQEQAAMLKRLNSLGYYANFGVGYDHTIDIIEWYLGTKQYQQGTIF